MATSTELLSAAEHMRHQGALMLEDERWHAGTSYCEAADMLELEAKRLQAIEAKQPKPADSYCSDAVGRYDGTRVLVEETTSAYAVRLKDNPDNSLHVGKRCDGPLEPHRFLLALCKEVVRPLASRSWPEGWPPFAVLRRAYSATGMHHYPSTRVCERSRVRSHRAVAAETRARWQRVLLQVLSDPSSP